MWCWRRLLRVPWTARRSNQSILKEINPEYSSEELRPKLKLQYFGHQMQRVNSLEKTWCWERLKAGGEGDNKGQDGWMASPTQWTWVWASSRRWWRTGKPGMLQSMGSKRVRHDWVTEQQHRSTQMTSQWESTLDIGCCLWNPSHRLHWNSMQFRLPAPEWILCGASFSHHFLLTSH